MRLLLLCVGRTMALMGRWGSVPGDDGGEGMAEEGKEENGAGSGVGVGADLMQTKQQQILANKQ